MTWLTTVLEILKEFFKAIPQFEKWRKLWAKTETEKIEDAQRDVDQDEEHFHRTGRPRE